MQMQINYDGLSGTDTPMKFCLYYVQLYLKIINKQDFSLFTYTYIYMYTYAYKKAKNKIKDKNIKGNKNKESI